MIEHLSMDGPITRREVMHGGTIMDATIHEAPKSTRNASQSRDPEMASTRKHGNYHFGAKSHIGVDAGTGLHDFFFKKSFLLFLNAT
jgi:IS5 family transposase